MDSAYVENVTGNHKNSNKTDDVIGLYIPSKIVYYFPRGFDKIFKNLKVIEISDCGLKVVHQSDLKPFSKLVELYLMSNQLEVLEKGLFDFNSNLELIFLRNNKISFIDFNVFDNLSKLKFLFLDINTCIDMKTENGLTDIQDVIRGAKTQCDDKNFSNILEKVQKLKSESKTLNSEDFKNKLGSLEVVVNNSKFVNYFEQNVQVLQADQMRKSLEEISSTSTPKFTISKLDSSKISTADNKLQSSSVQKSKLVNQESENKDLKKRTSDNAESYQKSSNLETSCPSFNETLTGVKNNIKDAVMRCTGNFAGVHTKFSSLNETILEINKTAADVKVSNVDIIHRLQTLEDNLVSLKTFSDKKLEEIDVKIDAVHTDLITATKNETNKFEVKIDKKFEEIEEKLLKIMKALKIAD